MNARSAEDLRRAEKAAYQAEEVRHQIVQCACDLFTHYGFAKTNIGDIARGTGMSPGNIYRYFRNKQAIGLAVIADYFRMVEVAMETELLLPGAGAEDRIRRFLTAGTGVMVREVKEHPKIVEMAEFLMEDEKGLELLGRHIAWNRERVTAELAAGIGTGEIAPCEPERTAVTLLNAIRFFFNPTALIRWQDHDTILPELNDILELMFRGLRARSHNTTAVSRDPP